MKTYMPSAKSIDRKWYVVDAEGQTLGRLATVVAATLRGKNKPTFTPFLDTGDYVIVVNADKIKVTGKKLDQKTYFSHSKYIGGVKETPLREMLAKKPERYRTRSHRHAAEGTARKTDGEEALRLRRS